MTIQMVSGSVLIYQNGERFVIRASFDKTPLRLRKLALKDSWSD
jgi:hypothetical protein